MSGSLSPAINGASRLSRAVQYYWSAMVRRTILTSVVSLILSMGIIFSSQAEKKELTEQDILNLLGEREYVELWTACEPVGLNIASLSDDARGIGLKKEDIEIAIRSRLRAAHIFDEKNLFSYPYVHVRVVGLAFSINFQFTQLKRIFDSTVSKNYNLALKRLLDEYFVGYVTTWQTGVLGTHGDDADYILSSIYKLTDRFIDEYLRVNAPACK